MVVFVCFYRGSWRCGPWTRNLILVRSVRALGRVSLDPTGYLPIARGVVCTSYYGPDGRAQQTMAPWVVTNPPVAAARTMHTCHSAR